MIDTERMLGSLVRNALLAECGRRPLSNLHRIGDCLGPGR